MKPHSVFALLLIAVSLLAVSLTGASSASRTGFTVSSSIDGVALNGNMTLSGQVMWTASSSRTPNRIEFSIDGTPKWTDQTTPYQFGGDPAGRLDTTSLSDGQHRLTVKAFRDAGAGHATTQSANVTISNGNNTPPPQPPPPSSFVVTSSIDDGATLTGSLTWTATPSGTTVSAVDFVIDGTVKWTEHISPYVFNGDGQQLDTATLPNGPHTLAIQAYAADGRTATTSSAVTVANGDTAPPPFAVTSNIDDGATVSGSLLWIATPSGTTVSSVDFLIDGAVKWTENTSPYQQELDTTTLANGGHTLSVSAHSTDGRTTTASSSVTVSNSSSAAPPPTGTGWTNVINSDFTTAGVLPAPWRAYNFANAQAGGGYYLGSHVVVSGGMVSLVQKYESSGPARNQYYSSTGAGWYQGTIYAQGGPWDSVDHRTTVRMRIVSTNGITSHRNLPMWWPNANNAPSGGEEDYFESDGVWWPRINGAEQPRSFFHYSSNNSFVYRIWNPIDVSQWHTYRFERRAHKITIWIDDMTTPVWSQQYSSTELPDTIKHPIFQQENPNFVPPSGTTGSEQIQIDWVTIDIPS